MSSRERSFVSTHSVPSASAIIWPWIYAILMIYAKILLVIVSISLFVATTVLLYGMLYWLVVPKRLHSYDAFFDYTGTGACANVTLAGQQWEGLERHIVNWDRPTIGFDFDVTLAVEYPASVHNLNLPAPVMFTTALFADEHLKPVVETRRAMTVPAMSLAAQWGRDILTMGIVALQVFQDKMSSEIVLIDSVPILEHETVSMVTICMQPSIHVYKASVHFESKLSGIRYLIAHHPVLVGIAVVSIIVGLAIFGVLAAALVRFMRQEQQTHDEDDSVSAVSAREEFMDGGLNEETNSGIRKRI